MIRCIHWNQESVDGMMLVHEKCQDEVDKDIILEILHDLQTTSRHKALDQHLFELRKRHKLNYDVENKQIKRMLMHDPCLRRPTMRTRMKNQL